MRIDDELYLDGGLRQNTPIAPALRLGRDAHLRDRQLARGAGAASCARPGTSEPARAPGAAFLLGKVLNAFLLDHVDVDIELLTRINSVLVDGTRAYGPGFTERSAPRRADAAAIGVPPRATACACARARTSGGWPTSTSSADGCAATRLVTKRLFSLLDLGVDGEADLASYLLFDGPFCRKLIEMGRADAQARRDELMDFFRDDREPGGGDSPEQTRDVDRPRCDSGLRPPELRVTDGERSAELVDGARALADDLGGRLRQVDHARRHQASRAAVEHQGQALERRVDLVRDRRRAPRPAAPPWSR